MHGKNIATGLPYNYSITFPKIPVNELDYVYEISFWLFYLCDGFADDCRSIDESITVRVNEIERIYQYDELINNPTWAKKSIKYSPTTEEINVFSLIFSVNLF